MDPFIFRFRVMSSCTKFLKLLPVFKAFDSCFEIHESPNNFILMFSNRVVRHEHASNKTFSFGSIEPCGILYKFYFPMSAKSSRCSSRSPHPHELHLNQQHHHRCQKSQHCSTHSQGAPWCGKGGKEGERTGRNEPCYDGNISCHTDTAALD